MKQAEATKTLKKANKSNNLMAIRFNNPFIAKLKKLVDRANKKSYGRKVKPSHIITQLFFLSDEVLKEKVIKQAQEESLTLKNREELFEKENLNKFGGSKEEFNEKMRELMGVHLSQKNS